MEIQQINESVVNRFIIMDKLGTLDKKTDIDYPSIFMPYSKDSEMKHEDIVNFLYKV